MSDHGGIDYQWTDLNGDGIADTVLYDTNGDGYTDVQMTDFDGDGSVDMQLSDANADGIADVSLYDLTGDGQTDVEVDSLAPGVDHIMVDSSGDGVSDGDAYAIFPTGDSDPGADNYQDPTDDTSSHSYSDVPISNEAEPRSEEAQVFADPAPPATQSPSIFDTPSTSTATDAFAGVHIPSDTAAVMDMTRGKMADVWTLADPNSSAAETAAAAERSFNGAQSSAFMAGYTYQSQVSNEIYQHDQVQQWQEQAQTEATDDWIAASNSEDQASWAVWDSQSARSSE